MEYFIESYQNQSGTKRYKLTRNGTRMSDTVNLYLNGRKTVHEGEAKARRAGKAFLKE